MNSQLRYVKQLLANYYQIILKFKRSEQEWLKFKDPSDDIDASNPRELNTFLSLAMDNSARNMEEVMGIVQSINSVAKDVDDTWADSLTDDNRDAQTLALHNLKRCFDLINMKLDSATAELMKYADEKLNDKTELNVEESVNGLILGVWASYSPMRPIRRSVNFEKIGVQIDIPKQILQQDTWFVHRICRMSCEATSQLAYESAFANETKSGKYLIGDLIFLEILRPPSGVQGIRAKKWVIRNVSQSTFTVQRSTYPSSVACRVFIKIPDEIYMSEDVSVAVWDPSTQDWSDEGITDFQYTESNRTCQFYVNAVGMFGLVKDRRADLPYKKWSISPVRDLATNYYEQYSRVIVQTQRVEVVIDVVGHQVRLLRPTSKHFKDLLGVLMSPGQLLRRLQKRGINIMPRMIESTSVITALGGSPKVAYMLCFVYNISKVYWRRMRI